MQPRTSRLRPWWLMAVLAIVGAFYGLIQESTLWEQVALVYAVLAIAFVLADKEGRR